MKLVAGNSNPRLAEAIAQSLDVPLTKAQVKRFADNEAWVTIEENVRGEDVFVLQSTSFPANDNLMELLVCIDALKRASAKLVANLITRAGADRVLTMDLHSGQIQGFFDIPTDNLQAAPLMAEDIKAHYRDCGDLLIVSPDVGGVVRALALARRLNAGLAIVDKRRQGPGVSEVANIVGDVAGRRLVIFDDIVDSATTLCSAAKSLTDAGALEVSAYVIHGVLSGEAVERVNASVLKELVVTDSITSDARIKPGGKIRLVSCARLIGEAIRRIANEESVSKLFD